MADNLRFHPQVASDLADATGWYEQRSVGLGERLRAAVDARFDQILENPELFARAFDDVDFRFVRVRRCPSRPPTQAPKQRFLAPFLSRRYWT
jgi:hypothetical protein